MNANPDAGMRRRAAAVKATAVIALIVMLSGCSVISQPPSDAKSRRLEEGRPAAERDAHVRAETKKLEARGLTSQEARSLAEAHR